MKSKVTVEVRSGNIESALKVFKKKVFNSGHLDEYKKRQEYIKPSVINREKRKNSKWQQKKNTKND
jgi:ribosomal protein S21